MWEADDHRFQPFLVPIELTHFHGRAGFGIDCIKASESNDLAENRGFYGRRNLAHLGLADANAITAGGHDAAFYIQTDKLTLQMVFPLFDHRAADKVVSLCFQGHRETYPRFERISLVGKLIAGKNQTGLDPEQIERLETERCQTMRFTGGPYGVEDRFRILRVTKDLVTQLAGISGTADDAGNASIVANLLVYFMAVFSLKMNLAKMTRVLELVVYGQAVVKCYP